MSSSTISKKNTKTKKEIFEEYVKFHDLEKLISEMTNSVVHSLDPNPIIFMIKYLTGLLTEEERIEFNINIDPPYPKGVPIVKFPNYKTANILSNYLTKSNWHNYKYIKTSFNNDINNLTHLSEYSKTDKIGISIVDKDCLNSFKPLLEKIIYVVHDINENKNNHNVLYKIGNSPKLQKEHFYFSDGLKSYIKSLRFWFSRNIEGYSYNNIDKRNGNLKDEIEKYIVNLINDKVLPEDLKKVKDLKNYINGDLIIKKEYQWMNEAGFINRNYTMNDRSIWANSDNSLIILINFANHFEIISTIKDCDGDSIQEDYNYIMTILNLTKIKFTFDVMEKFGYINSQVSLVGGGLRIIGVFKLKNIKQFESILNYYNFVEFEIMEKEELFLFTKEYHLCEKDILSFLYKMFVNSYGIKFLCENHETTNVNFNKISNFKNKENPIVKAYMHCFDKIKYEINLNGNNINELIEYFKLTENEEDFLFKNKYCYNIFYKFINKYLYYNNNISLDITNFMEKPEEPKDISDIQANDYIESIDRVKVFIFRNINDYPFPIDKQYNCFNEKAVQLVKKALSNINRRSKIGEYFEIDQESLIIIKNNGVDILHNDNMQKYDLDSDFPKNRGLIIFIYPHLYATVNDINHVNFIISNNNPTKKDDLKNELENLINVVNRFSREIKFAFDDKFGFMTTCPKFMGNGVKISIDLKLNKLDEDYLNNYVKDKNMTWSLINENKDGKTIIRLENKCSFEQSETEMFCNWIYYINELVNESVND